MKITRWQVYVSDHLFSLCLPLYDGDCSLQTTARRRRFGLTIILSFLFRLRFFCRIDRHIDWISRETSLPVTSTIACPTVLSFIYRIAQLEDKEK